MALIRIPKGWEIPERLATPEDVYMNRRRFMKGMGTIGAGMLAGSVFGCAGELIGSKAGFGDTGGGTSGGGTSGGDTPETPSGGDTPGPTAQPYPPRRNPAFEAAGRPLTDESVAARFINFYEFTTDKTRVRSLTEHFTTRPWEVEVTGLVDKPGVYDPDDLVRRMPLEERVYRFRCVEAWAMTVPWTGFPFKALIDEVQPKASAKYVRMVTFLRPDQAPGQKYQTWYPWPYFEGLTMDEAMNDLTMLVTGIYGHELPKQHGAPLRLIVPWKYGYKSIKSIVSIEFTDEQPPTFWNELAPTEYDFLSNVNPSVPHPRWSQASEGLIGTNDRVPTRIYNGYGEYVAHLYGG